jgi:hypothetical protein
MIWRKHQFNLTYIPAYNAWKIRQTFSSTVTLIKNDTFPHFYTSCPKMCKSHKTDPIGLAAERRALYRLIPPNS